MEEIQLIELKPEDTQRASELAATAREIWTEHYTPIIGAAQVEYMLDKFQSAEAILRDISSNGYRYFIAYNGQKQAGYFAIKPDYDAGGLFLSKLYIKKSYRGLGISRLMLNKQILIAKENKLSHIWLTVNKNNNSVKIYRKLGFEVVEEMVTDIGDGFVMDDYRMKLTIQA